MKKSTLYKICSSVLQILPPVVVLFCFAPVIIHRADKIISLAAIVVIIVMLLVFKDAFRRFFKTPSAWKFGVVVLIICLLCMALQEQLLYISIATVAGGLLAMPFEILYGMEVRPPTNKEMMEELEKIKKDD